MRRRRLPERERGQAHTLEASVAALLLLVSIGTALQMTAVTPLSASTSSQHLENQLEKTATGVLVSSAESGSLQDAVLYWNDTGDGRFHGTTGDRYYTEAPPKNLSLGQTLERTLDERNVAYNVYVVYQNQFGNQNRKRMIYRGEPSEHAVSASHTVTIVDDDTLRNEDESAGSTTVTATNANASTSFYLPDSTSTTTGVYNQVRVEVVAWRI